jgi:hypothetical protein
MVTVGLGGPVGTRRRSPRTVATRSSRDLRCGSGCDECQQSIEIPGQRHRCRSGGSRPRPDEVQPGGDTLRPRLHGDEGAQTTTDAVPIDGCAHRPPDGVAHPRGKGRFVCDPDHPQLPVTETTTLRANTVKAPAIGESPDQAERRRRPLARRDLRTARPARVDIRCRNPCFFARRRLFGWNVRFTHASSIGREPACTDHTGDCAERSGPVERSTHAGVGP